MTSAYLLQKPLPVLTSTSQDDSVFLEQNITPCVLESTLHTSSVPALCEEELSSSTPFVSCFQSRPVEDEAENIKDSKPTSKLRYQGPANSFSEQHILPNCQLFKGCGGSQYDKRFSDSRLEAHVADHLRSSASDTSTTAFQGGGSRSGPEDADRQSQCSLRSPEEGAGSDESQSPKSCFRGVSYDKKKRKWRVQIKIANLGRSGVSVGYFETEEAAAMAYDRAAISLHGKDCSGMVTNFPLKFYQQDTSVLELRGKSREEVKASLKFERNRLPRKKLVNRARTSRFMGVGSSNRKNQWQARILVHGKVTHLGYYETEEEAARVYDRVAVSLNGFEAPTNFPARQYSSTGSGEFRGLAREDVQRALGVKPMDKSSQFRGVSRKKGKWEAKVMVNRKWAFRALFDSEDEAAHAYDAAVWRLKPAEAKSFVNFDGSRLRCSKRPQKAGQGIIRSKSQKLGSLFASPGSGCLEPLLGDEPTVAPSTPGRRHSVQLPLAGPHTSPSLALGRQASATTLPPESSLSCQAEKVAQLNQEDLLQPPASPLGLGVPAEASSERSYSRHSSFSSLQPSLATVTSTLPIMSLPDPNSIGVPPPDNVPFPELVGGTAGAGSQPAADRMELARASSSGLLNATSSLVTAGSGMSDFPKIPPALLPTMTLGSNAPPEMGMTTYFSSTPLTDELSASLGAGEVQLQNRGDERQAAEPPANPNPFQKASTVLPPITSQNSGMLVRAGSEVHLLPEAQLGAIQKLGSLTPSLDVFPGQQPSMALSLSGLASNTAALQRATSESVLRSLDHSCSGQLVDLQVGSAYMGFGGPLLQHQGGFSRASQDHSSPRPPTQAFASAFPSLAAQAAGRFEGGLGSYGFETPAIHRSLSTSSLAPDALSSFGGPQVMGLAASGMHQLQHTLSLDSRAPGLGSLGLPPRPSQPQQPLPSSDFKAPDAAELMAELGVDVSIPEPQSPLTALQIGGEELPLFSSAELDNSAFLASAST